MIRVCKGCGTEFHHVGNTRGQFCNHPCYVVYLRTKPAEYRQVKYVTVTCDNCGKTFERRQQEVRDGRRFCSRECAGLVTGYSPRRNPPKPSVEKVCEQCGRTFMARASRLARRFCSRPCDYAWRAEHMGWTSNPNYRHGRNQTSANWVADRYYPPKCILCSFDVVTQVHHIMPKTQGGTNTPENLAVLCPNHHAMADRGIIAPSVLTEAATLVIQVPAPKKERPAIETALPS